MPAIVTPILAESLNYLSEDLTWRESLRRSEQYYQQQAAERLMQVLNEITLAKGNEAIDIVRHKLLSENLPDQKLLTTYSHLPETAPINYIWVGSLLPDRYLRNIEKVAQL
ncbi:MAG: hypothetical protein ACR2PX_22375 [Endozoicomonas sp.]|uniref:hypothetical protein n=1 Tax=Endozoicomonas sp. TaxID=1892382 RepID=UPI003D9B7D49